MWKKVVVSFGLCVIIFASLGFVFAYLSYIMGYSSNQSDLNNTRVFERARMIFFIITDFGIISAFGYSLHLIFSSIKNKNK